MSTANLASYAVQCASVLIVGLVAPRILGLRAPGAALRYWQALLAGVLLLPLLQPWQLSPGGSVTVELVGMRLAETFSAVAPGASAIALTEWALLAVAVVAVLRLGWLAIGLLVLREYRRRARPLDPMPSEVERLLAGSSARARFLVSDQVPTPMTFGWRRPTVLVPASFESLPEDHRRCISCHELLHVQRRDWLAVLAEQTLRALLWFHPPVLILLGKIELSREQLVDREVVRLTGNRRAYLDALLAMARLGHRPAAVPSLSLLNRSDLLERVALLAREATMSRTRILGIVVAAIAVVAVAGVSAAFLFPLTKSAEAAPAVAAATAVSDAAGAAATSADEKTRQAVKYDPEAGITAPKLIHKVDPVYPEEARKNGTQGVVICETTIDTQGSVVDVTVAKTTDEVFNQSAIDAIMQWK
jgi:beta-lactamase regulating signal transducer with metallopeptidase domain